MWHDRGTYKVHHAEQGTGSWKESRKGIVTSSNFGTVAGRNRYKSRQEYIDQWKSGTEETFSEVAKAHMARGTRLEPYVRSYYENLEGVKVQEIGLAVPKWDVRIGSSTDGLVGTEGCIEIKCPARMYSRLGNLNFKQIDRILPTHYDQMQGTMAILARSWCDYVVYCESTGKLYVERVAYDHDYWLELYGHLQEFMREVGLEAHT